MVASVGVQASQARVFALVNYPSEAARASQSRIIGLAESATPVRASQARVFALAQGRVADPNVRVFTFTLDGHDFYVLRLGNTETLIYDTYSEQWYIWGSDDSSLWRTYSGCNWLGGERFASGFGSSVVVGDDGNGTLYFLNPDVDADDDAVLGAELPHPFTRVAQGQLITKGYAAKRCYSVELLGSIGQADTGSVTLETSDDRGNTYVDHGAVEVSADDLAARIDWGSLGSMFAPGRLFRITDTGALKRIDSLDADVDGDEE
jgi:hypothetical protein